MKSKSFIVSEFQELSPQNGRRSFYNKAHIIYTKDGNVFLKSYDTIICRIDRANRKVYRYTDHISHTTCAHIKSFITEFIGGSFYIRGDYWKLPLEKQPKIRMTF